MVILWQLWWDKIYLPHMCLHHAMILKVNWVTESWCGILSHSPFKNKSLGLTCIKSSESRWQGRHYIWSIANMLPITLSTERTFAEVNSLHYLQWCCVSVMALRISSNLTVLSTACSVLQQQNKCQSSAYIYGHLWVESADEWWVLTFHKDRHISFTNK